MSDLFDDALAEYNVWGSCVLKWVSDQALISVLNPCVWGSCVLKWVSDLEKYEPQDQEVWGSCVLKWVSDVPHMR